MITYRCYERIRRNKVSGIIDDRQIISRSRGIGTISNGSSESVYIIVG